MGSRVPDLSSVVAEDGRLFHDRKGRVRELPHAPAPLADTHGHLTSFRGVDPAAALCRAALAGVRLLVVPVDPVDEIPRRFASAQDYLSWIDGQVEEAAALLDALAERGFRPPVPDGWGGGPLPDLVDNVRIVAGAHPYGAAGLDADAMGRLAELLESPRCVGVGEIGIDFGPYNELGPEVQERAFRRQLALARDRGLPVELHIRDGAGEGDHAAHDLAARVLEDDGVPEAGCDLHCFTDGPEVMAPFVELGCHIAFGGALTFGRSDDIRAAAALCPADRMVTETDCPYMAPVPLRGEECEMAMVAFTAARLAEVREEAGVCPRGETYQALWENARALFSRP